MPALLKKAAAALCALLFALVLFLSLAVGGISYLLQGIQQALLPLTGLAGSHFVTGLLCLLPILLAIRTVQHNLTKASSTAANAYDASKRSTILSTPAKLARQYPLEAATLAFVAGYTAEDEEYRQIVIDTTRACIRDAANNH